MISKLNIEKGITINASPEKIYSILTQVENWHSWTPSIKSIFLINSSSLMVGSELEIRQPKLPTAKWTITEIIKNKLLIWEKRSFGLKMVALHLIEDMNENSKVILRMTYEGFLSRIAFKVSSKLTEQYLLMEINGLKNECEKFLKEPTRL